MRHSPAGGADQAAGRQQADELARRKACVALAERELGRLRTDMAKRRERELTSLDERLAAADRMAAQQPDQAAAIYRAIIKYERL